MLRIFALTRAEEKPEMDTSGGKPDKKMSRREMKSKSFSLPPGAVLMTNPTGEGFFSKIKKCLRLKSKGKYDVSNHNASASESANGSPVSQRSRSTGSPTDEGCDPIQVRPKSSPIKMSRKSKSDKQEVILVRNSNKSSGGLKLTTKKTLEGSKEEILIVNIQDNQPEVHKEGEACASGVSPENELKNNLAEEELDPDYETLDEVRRKVRSVIASGDFFPDLDGEKTAVDEEVKRMLVRQPLQVKVKANGDMNGRDSGFDNDSPFTDSPGSNKENQPLSASSVLSTSAVSSVHPHCVPNLVVVNGAISLSTALAPNFISDSMTMSSMTVSCTSQVLEEDDLYSNAKVIIRKKSQKYSESSFSSDNEQRSSLFVDPPRSLRNSLTPADLLAMMETDNPDQPVPPPLPVRNYSAEEDLDIFRLRRDGQKRNSDLMSKGSSAEAVAEHVVLRSDGPCHGAGARPKTYAGSASRSSTVMEVGPVLSVNVHTSVESDDALLQSSQSLGMQTPITPTNNIYEGLPLDNFYEDIPARTGATTGEQDSAFAKPIHIKDFEDDLAFIDDEDLSPNSDIHIAHSSSLCVVNANASAKVTTDVPADVMIVSASDSMLGNDTDDSQSHASSNQHAVKHLEPQEQESISNEPSSAAFASSELFESASSGHRVAVFPDEKELKSDSGTRDTEPAHSVCRFLQFPDLCSPTSLSPSTASSSPHLSSVSSLSAVSSPSPSSTDTLNNITESSADDIVDDTDDWEGKDQSPPTGPPIHVSRRQLQQELEETTAAPAENEPPPVPERRPIRRTGRDALSMDLSSIGLRDTCERSARSRQRHSTCLLSPAAQAHKDFLESMKQLKECGWYWGPLSYEEAENKLIDKRDGSFLVRDSSNENYILSLSFKSMGNVHHTRIEHHKGLFSFWSQPDSHGKAQICQFIEQTVQNSRNGRFLYFLRPSGPGSPPLPIQLLYPVSRFCRVPSLQHMCRFLVLRCVRRDHIDCLPIPEKVKGYLLEKQYYVETLEED